MKRIVPLALASCALLTGCGPKTHLDLELRSVNVTAARILTPAVTIVPPATGPLPAPLPPLPPLTPYLDQPGAPQVPPVVPPVACPKASAFAVPAKPGTPLVEGYPAAATYVQRAQGSVGTQSLSGTVQAKVVRLPSGTTSSGQQFDSWRVERRWGSSSSVEVYDLLHSSQVDAAIEPGIYLVGLAWDDPVLGKVDFRPAGNGIEVLPNPVAIAQQPVAGVAAQYPGSGTDPQTLTTLNVVRNVMGTQRVDVCGQLVDTYTVTMTGALVSRDARWQVSWTQQLATAYGGIDVASTLALTSPGGVSWTRTLRNTSVPVAAR